MGGLRVSFNPSTNHRVCSRHRPAMAAAPKAPRCASGRRRNIFALQSRSALNRESSGRMPFAWTLNPYRGCEFGCNYCYARYTHEFMEHLGRPATSSARFTPRRTRPSCCAPSCAAARDKGLPIALGTATDPYQPAEKQFEITRRMLEVFARFRRPGIFRSPPKAC